MTNKQSPKQFLESLQQVYLDKNYDQVVKELNTHKNLLSSPLYHYNLGTVYLKQEKFARGRYHLEKAYRQGFTGPQVLKNLDTAKTNLPVSQIEKPTHSSEYFYHFIAGAPSTYFVTASLFLLLIVILLKRIQVIKSYILLTLLGLLAFSPYLTHYFYFSQFQFAVAFSELTVREGPSTIFEPSNNVPPGLKMVVEGPRNNWFFIKSPVRFSGWVQNNHLGTL